MKTLLLMRHAKAAADGITDRDRPLTDHGRRDATAMAQRLRAAGLTPNHILCSAALRTRQTAEAAAEVFQGSLRPEPIELLYLASAETIADIVADLPAAADRVLLIGHNPGLEELVGMLRGRTEAFPTAAVAVCGLPNGWANSAVRSEEWPIDIWRIGDPAP